MSKLLSRSHSIMLPAAIFVLLSACQQGLPSNTNRASVAATVSPLVVDEIRVGSPLEGSFGMKPQLSKDSISVSVKTSGVTQGASLEVKVFDLKNGQVVANEAHRLKVSGPTTTDLLLKQEMDWSPGRHLVEVKLDGKLVGQRDIDVVDSSVEAVTRK